MNANSSRLTYCNCDFVERNREFAFIYLFIKPDIEFVYEQSGV